MPIDFSCPTCTKKYRVKDELAGKSARCSQCNERIQIPAGAAPASRAVHPASSPQSAAAPQPAAARPAKAAATSGLTAAASKPDELSSWFDSELKSAPASPAAPVAKSTAAAGKTQAAAPTRSAICPSCRVPLAAGAVICMACGFDVRKGEKLTTKKGADADDESAKTRSALGGAASFGRGALLSAIGALVGAGIWAGVAIALHVEIGYVAIGLGALAGLGMAFGHEDEDGTLAGITAAGISIAGILAAKFFIFQYFKNQFEDAGISLEAIENLTGESLSMATLFSPMDGLFILMAVGAAYKLGSGQATD